jgi:hypothetical protein
VRRLAARPAQHLGRHLGLVDDELAHALGRQQQVEQVGLRRQGHAQQLQQAINPRIGHQQVPFGVDHQRGRGTGRVQELVQGVPGGGQGRVVQGQRAVLGRQPGRKQGGVAFGQRRFQGIQQRQQGGARGLGAAGLDPTHVPLGHAGPQAQLQLAHMPVAPQRGQGMGGAHARQRKAKRAAPR